jgi:hypothetical protein
MRYVIAGAVAGGIVALLMAFGATSHALPNPYPGRPWAKFTLLQKERYVKANLQHARFAIQWAKQHRSLYGDGGARVIGEHQRLRAKATRNLAAIEAALHPPFAYPWWWGPLGACESGNDPGYNDGLYFGWVNFLQQTWVDYGGLRYAPRADLATEYEQYVVTLRMHADVPWSQSNPACSARLGM